MSDDFSGPAGSGTSIYFLLWQPPWVGSEGEEPHDLEALKWGG